MSRNYGWDGCRPSHQCISNQSAGIMTSIANPELVHGVKVQDKELCAKLHRHTVL